LALVVVVTGGVAVLTLVKAFARRIAGGSDRAATGEVQALREEVDHLRAELDGVHDRLAQVDEMQGRLDFAERMLAQAKVKGALPGGPL
jgi:hypothetical protein